MSEHIDYVSTMDLHLKNWDAEFAALSAQADSIGAEARAAYAERVTSLRENRDVAQRHYEAIRMADDTARAELQMEMDVALVGMCAAMHSASAVLRK